MHALCVYIPDQITCQSVGVTLVCVRVTDNVSTAEAGYRCMVLVYGNLEHRRRRRTVWKTQNQSLIVER